MRLVRCTLLGMTKSGTATKTKTQMDAIVAIYFPYLTLQTGRIACVGTLTDGTEWNARMPFDAAVAVEEAGHDIRIVGSLDD